MKEYRNEAHEFFSNLSDEEFFDFLEESGFELEPGKGEVVFSEEEKISSSKFMELISNEYYSQKDVKAKLILGDIKAEKNYTTLTFKNMKNSFNYEGYGVA